MNLNWIPNSLSMGNLFFGFLSIIFSAKREFVWASFFIMTAGLFDLMDGRIARKINKPNPIGKELDSLADLVTFCLAPGFMFYSMFFGQDPVYPSELAQYPLLGIFISFLFPLFGALRLAQFNVTESKGHFTGIPSTIAGTSCALILVFDKMPLPFPELTPFLPEIPHLPWWLVMTIFVGYALLMKSKFIFSKLSPSTLNFSKKNSLTKNILNVLILVAVVFLWKYFLIVIAILYTLSPIFKHKRQEVTS